MARGGIVREPEPEGALRAHEERRALKRREAEGLDRLQQHRGWCACASADRRAAPGLDLEVGEQVVREDDEVLPRAVGRVGHRRHGVEGQAGLELRDRLLVVAAAARKRARDSPA